MVFTSVASRRKAHTTSDADRFHAPAWVHGLPRSSVDRRVSRVSLAHTVSLHLPTAKAHKHADRTRNCYPSVPYLSSIHTEHTALLNRALDLRG